jgi:hypothetical protein
VALPAIPHSHTGKVSFLLMQHQPGDPCNLVNQFKHVNFKTAGSASAEGSACHAAAASCKILSKPCGKVLMGHHVRAQACNMPPMTTGNGELGTVQLADCIIT